MIKVSRVEISGLANALYGMRLPKNSNHKTDTWCKVYDFNNKNICDISLEYVDNNTKVIETHVGEEDKRLSSMLVLAGTDHGKWLRQIQVSMLIEAPMTFWWDFDTYKVATVKNSSSRMHKITSRLLNENDFSWDNEDGELILTPFREEQLKHLNEYIEEFNNKSTTKERKDELFRLIIQDLPDSYNFKAVWTGSAQTCRAYYFARKNHKQKELRDLAKIMSEFKEIGYYISLEKQLDK